LAYSVDNLKKLKRKVEQVAKTVIKFRKSTSTKKSRRVKPLIHGVEVGEKRNFDKVRGQIAKGFNASAALNIKKALQLTNSELAKLFGVSEKTTSRWKPSQLLKPVQSDIAYRVARIILMATQVLGDAERAVGWIRTNNQALGGATPLDCLESDIGTRETENVLNRIKYGIYS